MEIFPGKRFHLFSGQPEMSHYLPAVQNILFPAGRGKLMDNQGPAVRILLVRYNPAVIRNSVPGKAPEDNIAGLPFRQGFPGK